MVLIGDTVAWMGNNRGTVTAGPVDGPDGRRFWWVVMERSGLPTTVDDRWLRRSDEAEPDGEQDVGLAAAAKERGTASAPRRVRSFVAAGHGHDDDPF